MHYDPAMHPILGRTEFGFIYTFTAVFAVTILLSLGLTGRLNRDRIPDWVETAVFIMFISWLGARVGFVVGDWSYYQERPSEILHLWQGGLSYHGAMLAGLFALVGWCVLRKRPFAALAALFAPALVLIHAGGWLACYWEGCAYGAETTIGPFTANLPDTFGIFAVRYQTQLAGFLFCLLGLILILWLRSRLNDWQLIGTTLLLLSLIHLTINFFRGDIANLQLATLIDSGLILLSIIFIFGAVMRTE